MTDGRPEDRGAAPPAPPGPRRSCSRAGSARARPHHHAQLVTVDVSFACMGSDARLVVPSHAVTRPPGLRFDTGGTGEGLAVDLLAARLEGRWASDCGGDLRVSGLHGAALLGDAWLKPGPAGIAVPFVLDYRPVYTALGIVAGYLAALLGLSFYARRRVGARRWRKLHRATPGVYVLALGAGSDAGTPWLRATLLATAIPATGLLLARLIERPRPAKISVTSTEI